MQQALDYADTLTIPFVFSSSGAGFLAPYKVVTVHIDHHMEGYRCACTVLSRYGDANGRWCGRTASPAQLLSWMWRRGACCPHTVRDHEWFVRLGYVAIMGTSTGSVRARQRTRRTNHRIGSVQRLEASLVR